VGRKPHHYAPRGRRTWKPGSGRFSGLDKKIQRNQGGEKAILGHAAAGMDFDIEGGREVVRWKVL